MKATLRTSLPALLASAVLAQTPKPARPNPLETSILEETVITGKRADRMGETSAASQNAASGDEMRARPLLRRGEVLETIPGMVVTQHAGGGKANQYFLRGFNLDHGTDFATSLDGMPLNMRTHAHGQGYTDLNLIIPELIEGLDFHKGTHAARNGDLSSAGSAAFHWCDALPNGFATLEVGQYNYCAPRSETRSSSARVERADGSRSRANTTTPTGHGSSRSSSTAGTVSRATHPATPRTDSRSRSWRITANGAARIKSRCAP